MQGENENLGVTNPLKMDDRIRPKKSLGQHFLKDAGIIHEIIERARFDHSDHVLEIGAGLGALTLPLAGSVHQIFAVEKDARLAKILKERLVLSGISNVVVMNEDALRLDFNRIPSPPAKKIKVIGNLPYNISSPFLEKLVEYRTLVSRAVLMFQFELAKRLIAHPGAKDYGALSVLIQYYARNSSLLEVGKESFHPRPKVSSMVLELDFERPHPRTAENEEKFRALVKGAFSHRRKTILNSFKGAFAVPGSDEIQGALEKCDIDPKRRAETLGIDDFLCLVAALRQVSLS